jgi:hypothetical protein
VLDAYERTPTGAESPLKEARRHSQAESNMVRRRLVTAARREILGCEAMAVGALRREEREPFYAAERPATASRLGMAESR